jgi:tetrahydromethanopterin S-methyltransferase subunit E
MAVALWAVGAFILIVYFGTWALQIALWLLMIALRLGGWAVMIVVGLLSLLALAILDRRQLARICRGEPIDTGPGALQALKRWA